MLSDWRMLGIGRGRKGIIRCLRVLGFQIVISLGALGCVKAITPWDMARRPLHEPIRVMVLLSVGSMLLLLPVKGWLSGKSIIDMFGSEKASLIWIW